MLRTTTACNFSSLLWPAGSAPAALASLLFDPPEPQIIGKKHSVSRLSYLFAHLYLLSSDSFSSDLLSSNLPLLSASALLCFSSLHIVGSLTSKLPSIKFKGFFSETQKRLSGECGYGAPTAVLWRVFWNSQGRVGRARYDWFINDISITWQDRCMR